MPAPRLTSDAPSGILEPAAWHLLAVGLLFALPNWISYRTPLQFLAPAAVPQVILSALAFLGLALLLRMGAAKGKGIGLLGVSAAAAASYGASFLMLWALRDAMHSRQLLVVSAVAGVALAIAPYLLKRRARLVLCVMMAGAVVASLVWTPPRPVVRAPDSQRIRGEVYPIEVKYFRNIVPNRFSGRGGGIIPLGDGFLLVDVSGSFYRVDWNAKGDSLVSQRLALTLPMDLKAVQRDRAREATGFRLRVTGLLVDTTSMPRRVYASHQQWHADKRCFTMRVSMATLDLALMGSAPATSWTTVFETQPCIVPDAGYDDLETGGRMIWSSRHELLLTVGSHGMDGRVTPPAVAQSLAHDYGKILRLDGRGGREIVSLGHRNPQGLVLAADGRLWSTEHGPQGGDELNLIAEGNNYGWPTVTYGTDYGQDQWPIRPDSLNHGEFAEPAYAFMPSIGTANLIQLSGKEFPRWKGDLMIAALAKHAIIRVRVRGDRVIYTKPIDLGPRIRDLAEGSDGRIAVWTTDGEILAITRGKWKPSGADVFAMRCARCHELQPGAAAATAPSLAGIVGRDIASQKNVVYSEALQRLPGNWSPERLDAFLADPGSLAAGTPMVVARVAEADQRKVLIQYLSNLH